MGIQSITIIDSSFLETNICSHLLFVYTNTIKNNYMDQTERILNIRGIFSAENIPLVWTVLKVTFIFKQKKFSPHSCYSQVILPRWFQIVVINAEY